MYADKKMSTVAVVCNGIEECEGGTDESWLCTSSSIIINGTLTVCAVLLVGVIIYKLFKGSFRELMEDDDPLLLPDVLNPAIFQRDHDQRTFRESINLFIQKCKVTLVNFIN